jgi:hypothetical protein
LAIPRSRVETPLSVKSVVVSWYDRKPMGSLAASVTVPPTVTVATKL